MRPTHPSPPRRPAAPPDDYPSVLPADETPAVIPVAAAVAVPPAEAAGLEPVMPAAGTGVAVPVAIAYRRGVAGAVALAWRGLCSATEWLFGAAALTVGLAFLAALPIFQFLTLGYLLEAGGRVARTGRLREGFVGVRVAARAGGIVLGTWLVLWPLRLVSSLWLSAQLIDPDGPVARGWKATLTVLTVAAAVHVIAACSRGGKLRYFFWPLNPLWLARRLWRGGFVAEARDAVWDFVAALRLPYYFWLGLRGFAGGFIWLAVPVTLLALGRRAPLVGLLGAVLLGVVLLYVPFLQMRFAAEGRFRALFELRAVRRHFAQAPLAFAAALIVALLFAVPLYLLKIEMIPREAAWLPSVAFLVFIYPARLLAGWAYGLAARRPAPRHWTLRWAARLLMLPTAAFYVLIVFFTQYTAWSGIWSLYEQHAFLLPVPFVGM